MERYILMTKPRIKYQPVPTFVGHKRFDSVYEANIFKTLRSASYRTLNGHSLRLEHEPGICVKPTCGVFKSRKWKCDFRVTHEIYGTLHIEAKGFITDLWMHQLELLECCYPEEFKRLRVITSNSEVREKLKGMEAQIVSPFQLERHILKHQFWNYGNEQHQARFLSDQSSVNPVGNYDD